jgi:hypothetical protein
MQTLHVDVTQLSAVVIGAGKALEELDILRQVTAGR